jgi:hypothetical protein
MHCFNTEFKLFYWIVHRRFFVFAGKKGVSRVLEGKYKYPNTKQFLTEDFTTTEAQGDIQYGSKNTGKN